MVWASAWRAAHHLSSCNSSIRSAETSPMASPPPTPADPPLPHTRPLKQSNVHKSSFPQLARVKVWRHVAFWTKSPCCLSVETLLFPQPDKPNLCRSCFFFFKQQEKTLFSLCLFNKKNLIFLDGELAAQCICKVCLRWYQHFFSLTTVATGVSRCLILITTARDQMSAAFCPETREMCVYHQVVSFTGGNYTSWASLWCGASG